MKIVKKTLDRILESLMYVILISMVLITLWQVVSRAILKNPASFTTEFLRYALLWLALLAAAYAFGKKAHLSILFVKDKLNGNTLRILNLFTESIILFFSFTVLIYGGSKGVIQGMAEKSSTLPIEMGYVYIVFPLSGTFIILYCLIHLLDLFKIDKTITKENKVQNTTM